MSDAMGERLLYLADAAISLGVVKGTMLVGVAMLVAVAVRRSSAATRAGVWGSAVVVLVALPVLWHSVPWWDLGVIAFPRALFDVDSALAKALATTFAGLDVAAGTPPAIWLAVGWLVGAVALGAGFLWQRLGVELVARAGVPARDARTTACVRRLRQALGLRRPVRVIFSELTAGPYAFGVWRATVVLPLAARQWNDEQFDAVLRHEIAHITRGDYLLLLVGELARVLYWPNPAVWVVLAALRRAQEAACDDLVLRGGVPATAYARHLVAVARTTVESTTVPLPRAALPLLSRHHLQDRILAVLDRSSDRRPATRRGLACCGATATAIAVVIASANLWVCTAPGGDARTVTRSPVSPVSGAPLS